MSDHDRKCYRPRWPIGMMLPVGAIDRINYAQSEHDRDPDAYDRRARAEEERREEERRREEELEWDLHQSAMDQESES